MRYSLAAEIVQAPENVISVGDPTQRIWELPEYGGLTGELPFMIDEAVKVRADELAVGYWDAVNVGNEAEPLGQLRAPFPSMWIEWVQPDITYDPDGKYTELIEEASQFTATVGVYVTDRDMADGPPHGMVNVFEALTDAGAVRATQMMMFRKPGDHEDPRFLGFYWYGLDKDGLAIVHVAVTPRLSPAMSASIRSMGENPDGALGDMISDNIHPAALALGLMNCRNVNVKSVTIPAKLKKRKIRDSGEYVFSTIRLPNVTYDSRGRPDRTSGDAVREHKVRGHYKVYTEENPLFGKTWTGSIYVEWQVRGSRKKGAVDSDYDVRRSDSDS